MFHYLFISQSSFSDAGSPCFAVITCALTNRPDQTLLSSDVEQSSLPRLAGIRKDSFRYNGSQAALTQMLASLTDLFDIMDAILATSQDQNSVPPRQG